jgi:hypothetical protein
MLIEFSVGNYLSFKAQVTFSIVAANDSNIYDDLQDLQPQAIKNIDKKDNFLSNFDSKV